MSLLEKFLSVAAAERYIQEQSQKYYSDGSSELSDEEFDGLVDEIKSAHPESNIMNTIGWGYSTDEDSTPGEKHKHKYGVVGSLTKCRKWEELSSEFKGKIVHCTQKMDGLSVVMYYQKGQLVMALTRGDGTTGIDITDKIKLVVGDHISDAEFTGAVRGEIIMSYDDFEKFKDIHPDAKNPRNSVAGLINGKEITKDFKFLDVVVYTVVGYESNHSKFDTLKAEEKVVSNETSKMYEWLSKMYAHVAPDSWEMITHDNFLDIMNEVNSKFSHEYPSDGIVLSLDKLIYDPFSSEIQYVAQAFKFKSEIANSEVLDVEWKMSKTGYAVPRIHIKPVQLAGTTVQYTTGYNAKYIRDNHIGPGSIVEVEKRGEIIPNVNQVLNVSLDCTVPSKCLDCGSDLIWNGVNLQCPNESCKGVEIQDVLCWVKHLAPVDGFGDSLILKFLSDVYDTEDLTVDMIMNGHLKQYLNTVDMFRPQVRMFSDMIKKLYQNTYESEDALIALNIPRIGIITARKLASRPEVLKTIYESAISDSTVSKMNLVKYSEFIGNANMNSIINNLSKFRRWSYIFDRIHFTTSDAIDSRDSIKVAITGKLSVKRSEFEKELRQYGYTPAEIDKSTKFLITDNPNSTSSKNAKATQWGITKITEQEFRSKYMQK